MENETRTVAQRATDEIIQRELDLARQRFGLNDQQIQIFQRIHNTRVSTWPAPIRDRAVGELERRGPRSGSELFDILGNFVKNEPLTSPHIKRVFRQKR